MKIAIIGINYRRASAELRSAWTYTLEQSGVALALLKQHYPTGGFVLLSTCNRTELCVSNLDLSEVYASVQLLFHARNLSWQKVSEVLTVQTAEAAAKHVFKVCAGFDSMIFGEEQILGQVKQSVEIAREQNSLDTFLEVLWRSAITTGKQIRTAGQNAADYRSVATLVLQACQDFCAAQQVDFSRQKVLLVGGGKMSLLVAQICCALGLDVTVASRKPETVTAQPDFKELPLSVVPVAQIYELSAHFDVIVSATSSPNFILTAEFFTPRAQPQLLIDLAVPLDMDPNLRQFDAVELLHLDDLHVKYEACQKMTSDEYGLAQEILQSGFEKFCHWHFNYQKSVLLRRAQVNVRKQLQRQIGQGFKDGEAAQQAAAAAQKFVETLFYRWRDHCTVAELQTLYASLERAFSRW